jgi:hypothetical protein
MKYNARMSRIRKQMRQLGPMLKGTLLDRKIPCGKPSCRCKKGEGHPGLYLTYSLKGKTKTVYVPKKMSDKVREWAQNYAHFRELLEEMFQIQLKAIKEGK